MRIQCEASFSLSSRLYRGQPYLTREQDGRCFINQPGLVLEICKGERFCTLYVFGHIQIKGDNFLGQRKTNSFQKKNWVVYLIDDFSKGLSNTEHQFTTINESADDVDIKNWYICFTLHASSSVIAAQIQREATPMRR